MPGARAAFNSLNSLCVQPLFSLHTTFVSPAGGVYSLPSICQKASIVRPRRALSRVRSARVCRHPAHGVSQRAGGATWTASEGEPVVSALGREEGRRDRCRQKEGASKCEERDAPVSVAEPSADVRCVQRQLRVRPDVRVLTPISEGSLKAAGVFCSFRTVAVSSMPRRSKAQIVTSPMSVSRSSSGDLHALLATSLAGPTGSSGAARGVHVVHDGAGRQACLPPTCPRPRRPVLVACARAPQSFTLNQPRVHLRVRTSSCRTSWNKSGPAGGDWAERP